MVSHCVQNESPFGVLLIREGEETWPSTTHNVGTLARVTDWYQGSDGLLGITAIGEARFRLISTTRQDDGLHIGEIQLLENEPVLPLPAEYQEMAGILAGVLEDLGRLYESLDKHFDDASWVTSRFVEILPIDLEEKQRCLEQSDPIERLRIVRDLLAAGRR
jgi:Lon protease-like protein